MQMRAKRPHRFPFAFFGLRFTISIRAGCCVDRLNPPVVKLRPTEPYTPDEVIKILEAAGPKDRAFLLVGRYSGLRISDVATLALSRVQGGKLLLYTQKTGQPVNLPLPPVAVESLESIEYTSALYYFWTGKAAKDGVARSWGNRLRKVFDRSGVKDAHFHRLRDTFAVELLLRGTPLEEVSILLGHSSVRITEKHYAPWVKAMQQRLESHVRLAWEDDPVLNEPYKTATTAV